jgi:hypothetical protein
VLCLAGDAGRRALIARGAVSLVIGAAAGLTGMGASPGDVCARAGLAKGEAMRWGSLTRPFAVEGRALVVGSVGS